MSLQLRRYFQSAIFFDLTPDSSPMWKGEDFWGNGIVGTHCVRPLGFAKVLKIEPKKNLKKAAKKEKPIKKSATFVL